jgi:UDP-N-acetylmuramate--alanine ligase
VDFANKVPFYGAVVACADDAMLSRLLPRITRRLITYGLDKPADVTGHEVVLGPFEARCRVGDLGALTLKVPGRHNVQNALAAVAVGLEVGVPFQQIAAALGQFSGAERRFQKLGEAGGVLVIDDYGHHPTEIAAVIAAVKAPAAGAGRLVVVFQPHRYSRTRDLFHAFGPALAGADEIVLTDVYSAGEAALPGITLETFAAQVRHDVKAPVHAIPDLNDLPDAVVTIARAGDIVITLGAGSIGTVGPRILAALGKGARA